jgi:23S rRNA (guanosine2251-2'-O)-methyltransferase
VVQHLVLIAHNIRSAHNIGSLLRTADGLGIEKLYLTGYSPYPKDANDSRLPHQADRQSKLINKTALGAENYVAWQYQKDIFKLVRQLKESGYKVVALEQTPGSTPINSYKAASKIALIVGNEVTGIDTNVLSVADAHLNLPMEGSKESFNVSVAAALALYHLKLKGN